MSGTMSDTTEERTACANGAKVQLSSSDNLFKKLFSKPLPSKRTGAFYNSFPYQTKISPEAIAVYISVLTNPGDTVLDPFGGSGSTAVAALLCEHPTEEMKQIARELGVTPVWGARNAVEYELGTYASFAMKTLMNRLSPSRFSKAVARFLSEGEQLVAPLYVAKDPNGKLGIIRHVIWTEYLVCPKCNQEFSYFREGTSRAPVVFKQNTVCPNCKTTIHIDDCQPSCEEYEDRLLQKQITRKKRKPAWVYGQTGLQKWDRPVSDEDIALIDNIEALPFDNDDVARSIAWGDLFRSGYHLGITHLHHFYTRRNYVALRRLWRLASDFDEKEANALRLLLLSYNATHCTLMTRVVAKKHSKDFVLTGAQSGVLYLSRLPVEKNILLGLKRKAKPFEEVYRALESCKGRVSVKNETSEHLSEPSSSIDFVFTDPPFGDFIPYAEVNQINELWLSRVTDRKQEIVISPAQGKTVDDYGAMLRSVFSEMHRVIKPDGCATVVFHAAKADVWNAFSNAVAQSGFQVVQTNVLDKKQSSFKQIVSEDAVQGDPLLLLRRLEDCPGRECDVDDSLDMMVKTCEKKGIRDERRIYSLYVNDCLEKGCPVRLDAKEAYRIIKQNLGQCDK